MGRTIKTRHIQKDIKVLDKTVTAAEHMKGAYIRTRDSAEQTQERQRLSGRKTEILPPLLFRPVQKRLTSRKNR